MTCISDTAYQFHVHHEAAEVRWEMLEFGLVQQGCICAEGGPLEHWQFLSSPSVLHVSSRQGLEVEMEQMFSESSELSL